MSKANLLRQENADTGKKSNFWKNSAGQGATICAENGQMMFRLGTLLQAAATLQLILTGSLLLVTVWQVCLQCRN